MTEARERPIRVVVCEDDDDLRGILLDGLPDAEMSLVGVPSAEALFRHLETCPADILVLDLGLPGEDGLSAARRVRRSFPHLGILILTARGELEDRLRGLAGGADHYFVKPVDLRELAMAIRNLQGRLASQAPEALAWRLDPIASRLLAPGGGWLPLSPSELAFLRLVMADPGLTLAHDTLVAALGWADDASGKHRLEAMVSRLRKKARETCPACEFPVKSRHRDGYAFLAPGSVQ